MSRFCSLYSSSKGNSTYLSGGSTAVLVDAGVSFLTLTAALGSQGLSVEDLRGVLITHEHTDHVRGLKTLVSRTGIPVYASPRTLEVLCRSGHIPPGATLVECTGTAAVGDLVVTPFPTPHDACEPVGYHFLMPDQRTLAVATDLGHITPQIREMLTGCDLVMLESNYDKRMLECSRYPYYIKRRIKGQNGHLSNDDCSNEIVHLVEQGTTRLVLAHLSAENNLPELAYETGRASLAAQQMQENYDYILKVAPAHGPREVLVL